MGCNNCIGCWNLISRFICENSGIPPGYKQECENTATGVRLTIKNRELAENILYCREFNFELSFTETPFCRGIPINISVNLNTPEGIKTTVGIGYQINPYISVPRYAIYDNGSASFSVLANPLSIDFRDYIWGNFWAAFLGKGAVLPEGSVVFVLDIGCPTDGPGPAPTPPFTPIIEPTLTPASTMPTETPSPTGLTPLPTPTPTPTDRIGDSFYLWGKNDKGQLGNSTVLNTSSPVQTILYGPYWFMGALGKNHAAGITVDGSFWAWGDNSKGQLSQLFPNNISAPSQIYSDLYFKYVSCGNMTTAAISSNGNLWLVGNNDSGQLGDLTTIDQSSIVQINGGGTWLSVSMGYNHGCGIKDDNTLWAWGGNSYGQLGTGDVVNYNYPVQNYFASNDWKDVYCGKYFTLALKSNGVLYGFGLNASGELGQASFANTSLPVIIAPDVGDWLTATAGNSFSVAIRDQKLNITPTPTSTDMTPTPTPSFSVTPTPTLSATATPAATDPTPTFTATPGPTSTPLPSGTEATVTPTPSPS